MPQLGSRNTRKDRLERLYDKLVLIAHDNHGKFNAEQVRTASLEVRTRRPNFNQCELIFEMKKEEWARRILAEWDDDYKRYRQQKEAKAIIHKYQFDGCGNEQTIQQELFGKEAESVVNNSMDSFVESFMICRNHLNDIFGEEYVTHNPILVVGAVIFDRIEKFRQEITLNK